MLSTAVWIASAALAAAGCAGLTTGTSTAAATAPATGAATAPATGAATGAADADLAALVARVDLIDQTHAFDDQTLFWPTEKSGFALTARPLSR